MDHNIKIYIIIFKFFSFIENFFKRWVNFCILFYKNEYNFTINDTTKIYVK